MSEAHRHPNQPDVEDTPVTTYQVMARALEDLLIEKGVLTPDALRRQIEDADARGTANGARLIARAWTDEDFESRLLKSVNQTAPELGIDAGTTRITAVKNTRAVHNVIVCTLCSCYPTMLLGSPPDWYKSRAYRSRVVREPRAVLAEFGTEIGADVEVRVHDSSADLRYLVIPMRPEGTDGLDEEALAGLVTRDCMIGTALPRT